MSLFLEASYTEAEEDWKSLHRPFYFNHPSYGGIIASASEYSMRKYL